MIKQSLISIKARYFYLGVLIILAVRFFSSLLFSGLDNPPIVMRDGFFFDLKPLVQFCTSNIWVASVSDILLIFLPIMIIFLPKKTIPAILFSFLFLIYVFVLNGCTFTQNHYLVGVFVLSVCFWMSHEAKFELLWDFARYVFLFIFVSAAIYKMSHDGIYNSDQLVNILKSQHAQYHAFHPHSYLSEFYLWLIENETICMILLLSAILVEFTFVIGFFTKKFDSFLLVLALVYFLCIYVVLQISSFELLILGLTFLPNKFYESKLDLSHEAA